MTQDRTDSTRPLFADINEHDPEVDSEGEKIGASTGATTAATTGAPSGAASPAAVDPLSVGTPGAAAIPLGAPTSVKEPLEAEADAEKR